ncbi:MAG: hypothetical protein FD153_1863 [Rhodospirillaceae bacterium]|nr:MAG: hypothetical protein FD153_1863 [Rhodospirillaceae bacterium]
MCLLGGEVTRDHATAAQNGLANHRRADDLPVKHDSQPLADVFLGHLAEPVPSQRAEAEVHDRLVVLERGLCIDQLVASDFHFFPDRQHSLPGIGTGQEMGARGNLTGDDVLRSDSLVHQMESQFSRAADQPLDAIGIVHAGQLDDETVGALAQNGGFAGSRLIHPPADNLDGLEDSGILPFPQGFLGVAQRKGVLPHLFEPGRTIKRTQELPGRLTLGGIGNGEGDVYGCHRQGLLTNPGLPQGCARVLRQVRELFTADVVYAHLDQQMGPSLQIQAKADRLQPRWQPGGEVTAQHIRHRKQHARHANSNHQNDFPL